MLDTEENHRFSDHYLELELDLSKVFWVLTANSEDQIPAPLRDRLEIINFPVTPKPKSCTSQKSTCAAATWIATVWASTSCGSATVCSRP